MNYPLYDLYNEFVSKEKIWIGGIHCLVLRPKNQDVLRKTIIYYHGWHSSKEYMVFDGTILATYGYLVILPDAIYHGERHPIDYDAPGSLDKYLWPIVYHTIDESKSFIEAVKNIPDVDPSHICVMGSSMGGFSCSGVFFRNQEIQCLVNINGVSAFSEAERVFREMDGKAPLSQIEETQFSKYDPISELKNLNDRPILMVHGGSDTDVPIDIQRYFYQTALPYYQNHDNIQLVEYSKVNHYTTVGMLEEIVNWLKKFFV